MDEPTFRRSELRDHEFWQRNKKAIERAVRLGRIVDDIPKEPVKPFRYFMRKEVPAPTTPAPTELGRRAGSDFDPFGGR